MVQGTAFYRFQVEIPCGGPKLRLYFADPKNKTITQRKEWGRKEWSSRSNEEKPKSMYRFPIAADHVRLEWNHNNTHTQKKVQLRKEKKFITFAHFHSFSPSSSSSSNLLSLHFKPLTLFHNVPLHQEDLCPGEARSGSVWRCHFACRIKAHFRPTVGVWRIQAEPML